MAAEQEDLLREVFRDLQGRRLVQPNRKLVPFKRGERDSPKFHAGILHRQHIYYWLDNHVFEPDGLRFILLHEERHLRGYLSQTAYLLSMIGWASLFVYLILIGYLRESPWSLLQILLVPAVWYTAMPFLRIDEYRCDLWAAKQMKDELGIVRPSEVVRMTMTFKMRDLTRAQRASRFFAQRVLHIDYHPPLEKRVARIASEIDGPVKKSE